jgi:hypothetical protein
MDRYGPPSGGKGDSYCCQKEYTNPRKSGPRTVSQHQEEVNRTGCEITDTLKERELMKLRHGVRLQ